jgi:hypothetical protein
MTVRSCCENAYTLAGDAGLVPSLVRTRPYHDDRLRHCHDLLTIHHRAVEGISLGEPSPRDRRRSR